MKDRLQRAGEFHPKPHLGRPQAAIPPLKKHLGKARREASPPIQDDPRRVVRLVNGSKGNYLEYGDGTRVSLTDEQWKAMLSRLIKDKENDQTVDGSATKKAG